MAVKIDGTSGIDVLAPNATIGAGTTFTDPINTGLITHENVKRFNIIQSFASAGTLSLPITFVAGQNTVASVRVFGVIHGAPGVSRKLGIDVTYDISKSNAIPGIIYVSGKNVSSSVGDISAIEVGYSEASPYMTLDFIPSGNTTIEASLTVEITWSSASQAEPVVGTSLLLNSPAGAFTPLYESVPIFSGLRSTATNPAANTWTKIDVSESVYASLGGISHSAGIITVPTSGVYQIDATLGMTSGTVAMTSMIGIYINGTLAWYLSGQAQAASWNATLNGTYIQVLSAGSTIGLYVYCNSAAGNQAVWGAWHPGGQLKVRRIA